VTLLGGSLRQTVHTHCASVLQAAKLVAALLRVVGVTAGLTESNGSLLPGLWLTSPAGLLPRTGISSGTVRSVIVYGLRFWFDLCRKLPRGVHKDDFARPLYRRDIFYSGSVLHVDEFRSVPDVHTYVKTVTSVPRDTPCCVPISKAAYDTLTQVGLLMFWKFNIGGNWRKLSKELSGKVNFVVSVKLNGYIKIQTRQSQISNSSAALCWVRGVPLTIMAKKCHYFPGANPLFCSGNISRWAFIQAWWVSVCLINWQIIYAM